MVLLFINITYLSNANTITMKRIVSIETNGANSAKVIIVVDKLMHG